VKDKVVLFRDPGRLNFHKICPKGDKYEKNKLIESKVNNYADSLQLNNKLLNAAYIEMDKAPRTKTELSVRNKTGLSQGKIAWISVSVATVLLVAIIAPILALVNRASGYGPYSPSNNIQDIIALAAVKTMDDYNSKNPSAVKSFSVSTLSTSGGPTTIFSSDGYVENYKNENDFFAMYPITGVRIDKAFEFYVARPDGEIDFVTEKTGMGELRVIVADFTTFKGLEEFIRETIVVVIGEDGIYHCLLSGQSLGLGHHIPGFDGRGELIGQSYYYNDGYYWHFMSHKILSNNAIIKDSKFAGNNIWILQYSENEFTFLTLDKNDVERRYAYIDETYRICENAVLYDLLDICLPSVTLTIKSQAEDYKMPVLDDKFNIKGFTNVKRILTSYFEKDEEGNDVETEVCVIIDGSTVLDGLLLDSIEINSIVKVEFLSGYQRSGEIGTVIALTIKLIQPEIIG